MSRSNPPTCISLTLRTATAMDTMTAMKRNTLKPRLRTPPTDLPHPLAELGQ